MPELSALLAWFRHPGPALLCARIGLMASATIKTALLTIGLAFALAGCGGMPTPIIRFAAGTDIALTQTAEPRPTRTHRPTRTPTLAPMETLESTQTPTALQFNTPAPALTVTPNAPTLPFQILSSTSTPRPLIATEPAATEITPPPTPSELDCQLVWQSPPNGATYNPDEKFAVGWDLRNVGTATWEQGTFEFVYLGGARLYAGDRVPLNTSVAPGDEIVLSLPMKTPDRPSSQYTTHWGIRQGDTYFCRLTLSIVVP